MLLTLLETDRRRLVLYASRTSRVRFDSFNMSSNSTAAVKALDGNQFIPLIIIGGVAVGEHDIECYF